MVNQLNIPKSTEELIKAFENDGYEVTTQINFQGKRGMCAESKSAKNYETNKPKKVLYVEGSGYQIGYLTGQLAPDDVELMATQYIYNFIPAMINPNLEKGIFEILWKLIWDYITIEAVKIRDKYPDDIPNIYSNEMKGMVDGCKNANPKTKVTYNKLWNLNTAIDLLMSNVYTGFGLSGLGGFIKNSLKDFNINDIRVPLFCNGFSVSNNATASKSDHFFGRSFMLTDAGILQDTACMIIYCPEDEYEGNSPIPLISMTAPGLIGSITALNTGKLSAGVDMVASANCDPSRPGFNSVLLVRYLIQYGSSAEQAIDMIANAQRGVSWLYILSDGKSNRAVVVETGNTTDTINYLDYPPQYLIELLPSQEFINENKSFPPQKKGMMVRWNDFNYNYAYLKFNEQLFKKFNKKYKPADFGETGFIDQIYTDTNCPQTFYFAPQREIYDDVVLTTNMYIIPEMRLCMMNELTVLVSHTPLAYMTATNNYDDIQWRYDELNNLIISSYGNIDLDKAISILDFLNPDGKFPEYYSKNQKSKDGKTVVIDGCDSLIDCKNNIIISHFGYYADRWIKISLNNYFTS